MVLHIVVVVVLFNERANHQHHGGGGNRDVGVQQQSHEKSSGRGGRARGGVPKEVNEGIPPGPLGAGGTSNGTETGRGLSGRGQEKKERENQTEKGDSVYIPLLSSVASSAHKHH
eukprot:Hpha_TRINITY_DN16484_c1_g8::TRINITY_DN16484_c1_g8_i2::g.162647::m.162647